MEEGGREEEEQEEESPCVSALRPRVNNNPPGWFQPQALVAPPGRRARWPRRRLVPGRTFQIQTVILGQMKRGKGKYESKLDVQALFQPLLVNTAALGRSFSRSSGEATGRKE